MSGAAPTVRLDASIGFAAYPAGRRTAFREPVHTEIDGDVFDRQRVMVDWDQALVEKQDVLVLGTGGLGMSVAMAMCRMGVNTVTFVDRDMYDATNLTRQILGSITDVGKRKTEVALRNLATHNLRSTLVPLDMDAVLRWGEIVTAASKATVVFNCIDYGGMFDYAVNSLCKRLKLPYITGSSFAWSMQTEYYSGKPGKKCCACVIPPHNFLVSPPGAARDAEQAYFIDWLKSAGGDGTTFSPAQLVAYLAHRVNMTGIDTIVDEAFGLAFGSGAPIPVASEFEVMTAVKKIVLEKLLPTNIAAQKSISFIPQEAHFPTRNVGSWVAVCVGAAMQMTNMWVQELMTGGDLANSIDVSNAAYSMHTDREYGGTGDSDPECPVCADAARLDASTDGSAPASTSA